MHHENYPGHSKRFPEDIQADKELLGSIQDSQDLLFRQSGIFDLAKDKVEDFDLYFDNDTTRARLSLMGVHSRSNSGVGLGPIYLLPGIEFSTTIDESKGKIDTGDEFPELNEVVDEVKKTRTLYRSVHVVDLDMDDDIKPASGFFTDEHVRLVQGMAKGLRELKHTGILPTLNAHLSDLEGVEDSMSRHPSNYK